MGHRPDSSTTSAVSRWSATHGRSTTIETACVLKLQRLAQKSAPGSTDWQRVIERHAPRFNAARASQESQIGGRPGLRNGSSGCSSAVGGTRGATGCRMAAVVIENEEADCGRKIPLRARRVDGRDKVRQCQATTARDFLKGIPEGIFEAYAGFVTGDHDGPFHNGAFHVFSLFVSRWPSRRKALFRCSAASASRSALVRPNRIRFSAASACASLRARSLRTRRRFTISLTSSLDKRHGSPQTEPSFTSFGADETLVNPPGSAIR
jgi:hypothetical protein